MNKKAGYAFRIVLGGYLAWLGIRMLMELYNERPSNMVSMGIISVVFTIIGAGYAIYCVKKVLDLKKEELGLMDPDEEPEVEEPVADAGQSQVEAQEHREALPNMSETVLESEEQNTTEEPAEEDALEEIEEDTVGEENTEEKDSEDDKAADTVAEKNTSESEVSNETAGAETETNDKTVKTSEKAVAEDTIELEEETDAQLEEDIENDYEEK